MFDHLLRGLAGPPRIPGWRALDDGHEHLWTGQFQRYAPAREYIVESLAELAVQVHVAQSEVDALASEETQSEGAEAIMGRARSCAAGHAR